MRSRLEPSYGVERDTLDVCFVANRYDPLGQGKGFDIFLAVARAAVRHTTNPISRGGKLAGRCLSRCTTIRPVTFYGYLSKEALINFYARMDLIVSPTRIDVPVVGKFDGFPLVVDAGMCGVGMIVTDPMGQNKLYKNDVDLWVVEPDARDITQHPEHLVRLPYHVAAVAKSGQNIIKETRDPETTSVKKQIF